MFAKRFSMWFLISLTLGGITTSLEANYYLDTLFPIGLTGLNNAGRPPFVGASGQNWKWTRNENPDQNEQDLIYDLGVNVIGCQDAHPPLLMDFNPDSSDASYWTNCYLHKICKNAPDSAPVYLITANYYYTPRYWQPYGIMYCSDSGTCCDDSPYCDSLVDKIVDPFNSNDTLELDSCGHYFVDICDLNKTIYQIYNSNTPVVCTNWVWSSCEPTTTIWKNQTPSGLFRPPTRGDVLHPKHAGEGSMLFASHKEDAEYYRHGRNIGEGDNWDSYDGDSVWKAVADEAIDNFDSFYTIHSYLSEYMWGWNLISEDPAVSRNNIYDQGLPPWRGCWAGVDYIFTGHKGTSYFLGNFSQTNSLGGIRGIENTNSAFTSGNFQGHRMIIAKYGTGTLHRGGYNIFQALPDLDAFVVYSHGWCHPNWNYGQQDIFDWWLYGDPNKPQAKDGRHNIAIYFQQYGKTYLAYPDQKRRWIASISIEWELEKNDVTNPRARRPCPPEIRCATYLSLSRGAKGILFHPWTNDYSSSPTMNPSLIKIPDSNPYTGTSYYYLGLRDKEGYPFGDVIHFDPISTHKLNSGTEGGSTYWHINNYDSTYTYLATSLIPEIKKIAPTLMQLDWVNGYSLNSTDPNWALPCPHDYVMEVSGVSYMDLGLFDHPYEPVGVEYFMLVNREGIADMTNRTVTVALDANHWPEEDTLILTDIANLDRPRRLSREDDRFTFTEVFEPGEGKLYRAAPRNEAPVTLLSR